MAAQQALEEAKAQQKYWATRVQSLELAQYAAEEKRMADLKKNDPIKFKVEAIKRHGLDKHVTLQDGKPRLLSALIASGQEASTKELKNAGYNIWEVRNIHAFLESGEASCLSWE